MWAVVIIVIVAIMLIAISGYNNQTTAISTSNRSQFVIDTPVNPIRYLQDDKFKYAIFEGNGNNYASISSVILFDIPSTFTLPSQISGIPIKKIGKEAFKGLKLNEVVLSDSIEEIGDSAFKSTDLRKISITTRVKRIGNSAFANCYSLEIETLRIAPGMTVETEAFSYVTINTLYIDSPDKCFPRAFAYAEIHKVRFGSEVRSLPRELFAYASVPAVKLPKGLPEIPEKCFYSSGLKKLLIPSSVVRVNSKALMKCIDTTPRRIDGGRDLRYNTTTADVNMNITIYCEAGSFAQSYARDKNLEARPISEYTD
ncbi:Leucine rich repeat-containing protein [Lachnospiraceae bacterium XBB2008]|nr:Leucine rich repeat-containing protein [Lachnospiraceae bacterium XBB2008]